MARRHVVIVMISVFSFALARHLWRSEGDQCSFPTTAPELARRTQAKESSDKGIQTAVDQRAKRPLEGRPVPHSLSIPLANIRDIEKYEKENGGNLVSGGPYPVANIAVMEVRIVDPQTGDVMGRESVVVAGIDPISISHSESKKWDIHSSCGMTVPQGSPLRFFYIILPDYEQRREAELNVLYGIARPGAKYGWTSQSASTGKWFYSVLSVPEDVQPGQWLQYDVPYGVGIHPAERPDPRPDITIRFASGTRCPLKTTELLASYHRYVHYEPETRNSSPLLRRFKLKTGGVTASLVKPTLGRALTVGDCDRTVTWMYVENVSSPDVQLPRDADFVLKSLKDLRSVAVPIPEAVNTNGYRARTLELSPRDAASHIPLTTVPLTESVLPPGGISYEDRPLATVDVEWLPGTYNVVIRGIAHYDEAAGMDNPRVTAENVEWCGELMSGKLCIATGTLVIPERTAQRTPRPIDNLQMVRVNGLDNVPQQFR